MLNVCLVGTRRHRLLSSAALLLSVLVAPVYADEWVAALEVSAVSNVVSFDTFAVSPDESSLAFSACVPGEAKSFHSFAGCSLWILERETRRQTRISPEGTTGILPSWSPDGRELAFQSVVEGEHALWIWNRDKDDVREVQGVRPAGFGQLAQPVQWLPNGKALVVKYWRGERTWGAELAKRQTALPIWASETKGIDVAIRAGRALTHSEQKGELPQLLFNTGLALVDLDSGHIRDLTQEANITGTRLSPDGKQIAFMRMTGQTIPKSGNWPHDLVVLDLDSGQERVLASGIAQYHGGNFGWSPDSRYIAYLSGPERAHFVKERGVPGTRLAISSRDGSTTKIFDDELLLGVSGYRAPVWSCDARAVIVPAEDGVWTATVQSSRMKRLNWPSRYEAVEVLAAGRADFLSPHTVCGQDVVDVMARDREQPGDAWVRVDAKGRVSVVPLPGQMSSDSFHSGLLADRGQRLLTTIEAAHLPVEFVQVERSGKHTALTRFNEALANHRMGKARYIHFSDKKGRALRAALLLPADYEPGKRFPTIVDVYPDAPFSRFATMLGLGGLPSNNAQMLATRGYAVLKLDSRIDEGSLARDVVDAVHAAVDKAAGEGFVDPERLALRGCSFGGYGVLATLMLSDRFKAGIAECPVADLGSFWGLGWKSFLEEGNARLRVSPWQDPARYIENSPFWRADRINTPVLLIVGEEDDHFVIQSEQMYNALNELGREVVMLTYAREAHGLRLPPNVEDAWRRMIAFLDAKLKNSTGLPAAVATHTGINR